MKIKISELRGRPDWHQTMSRGKVSGDGFWLILPDSGTAVPPVETNAPRSPFPSLPRQAGHAVAAVGRVLGAVVAGRAIRVPPDVQTAREAICSGCEENLNGRCKKCGCGVKSGHGTIRWVRKTWLATEQCPLTPPKWLKYDI